MTSVSAGESGLDLLHYVDHTDAGRLTEVECVNCGGHAIVNWSRVREIGIDDLGCPYCESEEVVIA